MIPFAGADSEQKVIIYLYISNSKDISYKHPIPENSSDILPLLNPFNFHKLFQLCPLLQKSPVHIRSYIYCHVSLEQFLSFFLDFHSDCTFEGTGQFFFLELIFMFEFGD
jgi:hypothetical protein